MVMAQYDTSASDRQLFRDWATSYDLDPDETTEADVDRYLAEVPGAARTQNRRRAAAMQVRSAAGARD